MTSLNGFLPKLRKWKVHRKVYRVFIPTFKTILETVCVLELESSFLNFRYYRYFNGQLCNDDLIMAIFVISDLKSMKIDVLYLNLQIFFVLTVFRFFGGYIG